MGNALTDALRFKKSIGSATKGLRPSAVQHINPESQGHHGVLAFHKSKVPNLGNAKEGDRVTAMVHGSVHSVDPNGNMTMHVHDVKPDTQAMEKTQHPEQKVPDRGIGRKS